METAYDQDNGSGDRADDVALATAARADRPAGFTCAAKLDADAKAIYAATMAAGPTTDTLRSVVEQQTRSLAMAGKIDRGEATGERPGRRRMREGRPAVSGA